MLAQKKVDLVASDGAIAVSTIKELGLDNQFVLSSMNDNEPPSYIAFSRDFSLKHDVNELMSRIANGS